MDAVVVKDRDGHVANRPVLRRDRGQPWPGSATSSVYGPAPAEGAEVLDERNLSTETAAKTVHEIVPVERC